MASEGYAPALTADRSTLDMRIVEIGFVLTTFLVIVGLEPFDLRTPAAIAARDAASAAGDTVRQIAFICTFALVAYGAFRKRGVLAITAIPLMIGALLAWCFASALWADEPAVVLRRAVLASMFAFSMLLSVDTLGSARTFVLWRYLIAAIIIADITSVFFVHAAIHQPDDVESDLAGAWRGLHSHKNMAGSVATAASIMFLFCALETKRRSDILLCLASTFFLIMTRSKSSLGLLPVALFAGFLYRAVWRSGLDRAIAATAATIIVLIAGVAVAVEWDPIMRLLEDPTQFTGRSAIWQAEIAYIHDHPFLGAAFGTFGNTGLRSPIYPYVGPGWVAQIGEGHSGYLEMLVTIGGVGFAICMIGLLILPFLRFWRMDGKHLNFNAMLFALFTFDVLHNFMESDFVQVTSAQWGQLLLVIGVQHAMFREAREKAANEAFRT